MRHNYAAKALKLTRSTLPQETVIARLQKLVKKVERDILRITTSEPVNTCLSEWAKGHTGCKKACKVYERVRSLLIDRMEILNILFQIHCTNAEVERFKAVNAHLHHLTNEMYRKTADTYERVAQWPRDDSFACTVNIEGSIGYCCESESDFARLENDEYYCSNFGTMFAIASAIENGNRPRIVTTCREWNPTKGDTSIAPANHTSENVWDAAYNWNEGVPEIPQLKGITLCYALYDICLHRCYSIPDLLRMKQFTAKVTAEIKNERNIDHITTDGRDNRVKNLT